MIVKNDTGAGRQAIGEGVGESVTPRLVASYVGGVGEPGLEPSEAGRCGDAD